jgi:hypothetical protein
MKEKKKKYVIKERKAQDKKLFVEEFKSTSIKPENVSKITALQLS